MKKIIPFLLFLLAGIQQLSAQVDTEVRALVNQGIALHDKGEYEAAIEKYNAALAIDKNDYYASYEKSYTCFALKRYKECIDISKMLLQQHPDNPNNKSVYVNYGSSLDDDDQKAEAVRIYKEGIKKFPGEGLLHYNCGLTQARMGNTGDALVSLTESLRIKPVHPGSNYLTAVILEKENKIAALMAVLTFLAVEPASQRSADAFKLMEKLMYGNIRKKDEKNTEITMVMPDAKNEKKENNFSSVEMITSLMFASAGEDEKDKKLSAAEKLSKKLELLSASLSVGQKDGKGFYWKFYAPFIIALNDKKMMPVLSRLIYATGGDAENSKWLEDNKDSIDGFYTWLAQFEWKVN
jgi:tetratricopeptide (TPR) repeat protein